MAFRWDLVPAATPDLSMSSAHIPRTRGLRTLLLGLALLTVYGISSVLWRAAHGGDAPVNIGRIPMPYHQAFRPVSP
jgi:hypothetical protein